MHEIESIYSPDSNVQFKFLLHESRLKYAVTHRSKPVIEESPIGITVDEVNLTEGVEVGDVKQIVNRVEDLLDDGELRQRFVKNSQETLKKFSWESSIDQLEKALSNIAGS